MRTVLLMQCLTEIDEIKDRRRVPVTEKCMREVGRVSGDEVVGGGGGGGVKWYYGQLLYALWVRLSLSC